MTQDKYALLEGIKQKMQNGYIGVDEAGRGCMAGPVCAAALFAPAGFNFSIFPGLTDSKKITPSQRHKLEQQIKNTPNLIWGIGMAWAEEIDRVNILNATFRAMSRAILSLHQRMNIKHTKISDAARGAVLSDSAPARGNKHTDKEDKSLGICFSKEDFALSTLPEKKPKSTAHASIEEIPTLIDGPHIIPLPQWQAAKAGLYSEPPRFFPVIKGDALVPAISAASILAKEQRDRLMVALGRRYPLYGFAKHKGYGTKEHMLAIHAHGYSPQHRRSFGQTKTQTQLPLF